MEKDSAISILTQQAINSGRSILQVQQTLTSEYGQDLRDHPEFQQLLAEIGDIFSASTSAKPTTIPRSSTDIFHQLQLAVRDGAARDKYPIGMEIPDQWTDLAQNKSFSMPWRIVDYQNVLLVNGEERPAVILLRIYASPVKIKFSERYVNVYDGSHVKRFLQYDYRDGCTPELLDVIAEIKLPGCVHPATLFIPRAEELHIATKQEFMPKLDQTSWEYFRDTPTDCSTPCQKRVFRDSNGVSQFCWTRSKLSLLHLAWAINTRGAAAFRNVADDSSCILVACAIA